MWVLWQENRGKDTRDATYIWLLHQHHYCDKGPTGGDTDIDKKTFVQNPISACFLVSDLTSSSLSFLSEKMWMTIPQISKYIYTHTHIYIYQNI